jgi:SAM-dependent methyltransferase
VTDLGNLYRSIYVHAARLPGYSRYAEYAKEASNAPDALAFLARREDSYRAIALALESLDPTRASVLEVGSGLGYLTYALRKRGFNAVGLDLSSSAVADATSRYGPFYECTTLEARARRTEERFDLVVMTELIEHVTDPLALLQEARLLLAPGGRIVVTTPNRDAYPDAAVWRTEQPPVHLIWFSREGLTRLAARAALACEFLTFARGTNDVAMEEASERPPVLGRDGAPWRPSFTRRVAARLARTLRRGKSGGPEPEPVTDATLFAVLSAAAVVEMPR